MTFVETATEMFSPDYKQRFVAEYKQLEERISRLQAMLSKWDQGELGFTPTCPRRVLDAQLDAMQHYKSILQERAAIEGVNCEG